MIRSMVLLLVIALCCVGCGEVAVMEAGAEHAGCCVLYFTMDGCAACRRAAPIVDRIERAGHQVRRIDVVKAPKEAKLYRVGSVPTLVLLKNGTEVYRTQNASQLAKRINEF